METSENAGDSCLCPVCHDPIEIFAIGPCDHPCCYQCSTRMRVLCEANECPICRSLMPQVAFIYDNKLFKDINLRDCIPNRKYKIFFRDEEVENKYLDLLEFRCKVQSCRKRYADKTFNQLQTHMRREHQLFACDLCVTNLKIFPFERKFYSRKDLATHRRVGDADDTSYRGHPLCEFCDTRFNDKDDLWKHLRKDHYFCHFCDQHCSNTYYDQYADLLKHFADSHYLCQEGECSNPATRFTHAFVSDIDLKAHKAKEHNANLSRAQVREARHIEVDFHLAPRRQPSGRGNHHAGITSNDYEDARAGSGRRNDRHKRRGDQEDEDLHRAIEASKVTARPPVQERVPDPVADFPMLNGAPAPQPVASVAKSKEEDFPSLSSTGKKGNVVPQKSNKAYSSVMNHQQQQQQQMKQPTHVKKESKPVSLGAVPNVHKDRLKSHEALKKTEEDYPSLGGPRTCPNNPTPNVKTVNWAQKQAVSGISNGSNQSSQKNSSTTKKTLPNRTFNAAGYEFPSLNSGKRTENLNKNLFKESNKSQNIKKKPISRAQKFDESFELPHNYSSSVEDSSNNKKDENELTETTSNLENISITNGGAALNFPGWPARESKPEIVKVTSVGDKKKKKKKNTENSGKMDEKQSSLNNIAVGLLGNEQNPPTTSKQNRKNSGKQEKQKKTDWFDNPPEEYVASIKEETADERDPKNVDNISSEHTMSASVQLPKPPPGFSPENEKIPYTPKVVPPGFVAKAMAAAPPRVNPNSVYIQPPDFKTRNLTLIEDIKKALSTVEEGFPNFRVLSMTYRQNCLDASDYYFNCQNLMGKLDFDLMFPELLCLLPDIGKQHDLFQIHKLVGNSKPLSDPKAVSQCPSCGQVVMTQDVPHHRVQHGELENVDNFPSLGGKKSKSNEKESTSGADGRKGAWIRAK